MTDKEPKKVLSLGAKPKLELKKPISSDSKAGAGSVRQSFSHGRSKTVAVEVKRKREGSATRATEAKGGMASRCARPSPARRSPSRGAARGGAARQLTQEERRSRMRALRGAV